MDTSPWPLVRNAVLSFLRHSQSQYDERLRTRAERDQEFRDALASQVSAAAYKKYPWLRDDPRPFPESEVESPLPFDSLEKELAHLHSLRDQLVSAISDLKRQGNHRDQIAALEAVLEETRHDIGTP
jgi:hypothetical protein